METWQRNHIVQNLTYLISNTTCSVTFLAELLGHSVIDSEDKERIQAKATSCEKADLLFKLLLSRRNAFEVLKDALDITRQTGAYRVLDQCCGEESWKKVGAIEYAEHIVLGTGNNHTECFRGRMKFRDPVAVKKNNCKSKTQKFVMREVEILRKLPSHSNITQFYHAEMYANKFILIALEMCTCTLADFVEDKKYPLEKLEILQQITTGLAFLHDNKIIHRDLKPANILISIDPNRFALVKISDFGLSKVLDDTRGSVATTGIFGTRRWTAPEVLKYQEALANGIYAKSSETLAIDIFSLGCVFYFLFTDGRHPFGLGISCDVNAVMGHHDISLLDSLPDVRKLKSLIESMINPVPEVRPTCADVVKSVLFKIEAPQSMSTDGVNANTASYRRQMSPTGDNKKGMNGRAPLTLEKWTVVHNKMVLPPNNGTSEGPRTANPPTFALGADIGTMSKNWNVKPVVMGLLNRDSVQPNTSITARQAPDVMNGNGLKAFTNNTGNC